VRLPGRIVGIEHHHGLLRLGTLLGVEAEGPHHLVERGALVVEVNLDLANLADKISNLRDIAASPPPDWSVKRRLEYVHWARSVAQGLTGVSEGLEQEFDQAAKEVEHSAAVTR
jgi:hypothetical protein